MVWNADFKKKNHKYTYDFCKVISKYGWFFHLPFSICLLNLDCWTNVVSQNSHWIDLPDTSLNCGKLWSPPAKWTLRFAVLGYFFPHNLHWNSCCFISTRATSSNLGPSSLVSSRDSSVPWTKNDQKKIGFSLVCRFLGKKIS